jgi:ribonuclease HII
MSRAIEQLSPAPDHLLLDAVRLDLECAQTKIIHGDALSISIAAASIVAKVERDAMIRRWAPVYPEYDLASNKGYRSPKHIAALKDFGPTPLHRLSFAPVWMCNVAPQETLPFAEELAEVSEFLDDDPGPLAGSS